MVDSSSVLRGANYFMDCGRAATHGESMAILQSFGLTIQVGRALRPRGDEAGGLG